MMLNTVTEHLDLWTSAHTTKSAAGRGNSSKLDLHGIKKLRELILELAVRGKLVPQNPEDEPASVLLEGIKAKKAQLVEEKKIKKQKPLPPIGDDDQSFELPVGWAWSRLGDLGETNIGLTYKPANVSNSGIPVLRSSNIQNGKIDLNDLVRVSEIEPKESSFVAVGDLLICARNGSKALVGKTAKILELNEPMAFGAFMAIYRSDANPFIEIFLNSPVFRKNLEGVGTTTINQITQNNLRSTVAPVPPKKEWGRIVTKVNELMALCDQLEQQQTDSITAHQTLVEALLSTLTNSTTTEEVAQNWARIAEHFDTLLTTDHSVDQLKQTVLQLAVMGRLVPQNPNDEPASVLLEKIAAEKAQLVKDKKIKKQKPLPAITEEEKPFALPDGWEWCRFGSVAQEVATGPFGSMIHKSDYISDGIPLVNPSHMIKGRIVEDTAISVSKAKAKELDSYSLQANDIVMARRGEMGRCALVTDREMGWLCGTGSFVLRFHHQLSREFILLLFKTQKVKKYLGGESVGTTMTNLNHGILNKMPVPVPPVEECSRMVVKVSQLMALCETLKSSIHQTQTTQLHLANAIVEQAVA